MVPPDEAGVIITLGKHVRVTPPGWYIFWPLIQDNVFMVTTPQVVDLRAQSIRGITVSGAIEYQIIDIQKAILNVQDLDRSLQNYVLGVIADNAVSKLEDDDLQDFIEPIRSAIEAHVADWGIEVTGVFITDYVECPVYRIIGGITSTTEE